MIGKNITIKNYYIMLVYAFQCVRKDTISKVDKIKFENIYELFAYIFSVEIKNQIVKGLNREYNSFEEETSNIRGKINISETIKHMSFNNKKLYINYDEYNINSKFNQIIKATIIYILNSGKVKNKDYKKSLKEILKYFYIVDDINPKNIVWSRINYDRNNSSYEMLINICYFLLNEYLPNEEHGKYTYINYKENMKLYHLYEKFILGYYKYHHNDILTDSPKIYWNADRHEKLPEMKTDIVLHDKKSKKELIIDAKFYSKEFQLNDLYDKETFRSNNLYQIYSYVKNKDVNKSGQVYGLLLYAKTDQSDDISESYNMDGNIIRIDNLDLNKDFEDIRKKLESILDLFDDIK